MTKKHPSLLDGNKTLSLEEIANCYKSFVSGFKPFLGSSQIKEKKEEHRIQFVFSPLSTDNVVNSPSVTIEDREECAGFEKYRTIILTASNCGLCRGTKSVTFNKTTIHKFMSSLEIVIKLFDENTIKAFKQDKDQLEWQQVVSLTKGLFEEKTIKKDGYTRHMLSGVEGSINEDNHAKNFDIYFKELSPKQIAKLAKVVKDL